MSDRRQKRQTHREEQKGQQKDAGQRPTSPPRPEWPIEQGWKVYTADSATLGRVADAPSNDAFFPVRHEFLLRRHMLYVPLRFVRGSGNGAVMLRATKAEALNWRRPPSGRRTGS